jgi:hypothetical protein
MNTDRDTWIKPLQHISKYLLIFTMLIISIITSNIIGFLLYFTFYQIASVIRLVIYNILGQDTQNTIPDTIQYDYLDIAAFLTNNRIPKANLLPLFAISFTIAFVVYNTWNYPMTSPQIGITCLLGLYLIFQMLSVFMVYSPFSISPYFEILSGYVLGTFTTYGINKIYPAALFFANYQPRRKRMICRYKTRP